MYVPTAFREHNEALALDLVEEIRLGSLISNSEGIKASHLPFMIDRERGPKGALIGHMARGNPQWLDLQGNSEVLVTFLSPTTYISPSWYSTSPRAPTWNYVSIQVSGGAKLVDDPSAIERMIRKLSRLMEPPGTGWLIDDLDQRYVDKLVPAIIGFEIEITRIETQLRLSQQNNTEDLVRVHSALHNGTGIQRAVADFIERFSFRDRDSR